MTPTQLRIARAVDLARSGLTEADAKIMRIMSEPKVAEGDGAGYIIPYIHPLTGKPFTYVGRDKKITAYSRKRYIEDTRSSFEKLTTEKPRRYKQAAATDPRLYFSPNITWAPVFIDSGIDIVITEGEKKAYVGSKIIPTIGVGGVWNFQTGKKHVALLEDFKFIKLTDRRIIICYDSNATTNTDIVMAETRLAKRLLEEGARVYIARIPMKGEHSTGIDDYVVEHGAALFKFNILDTAFEYKPSRVLHGLNEEVVYIRKLGALFDYAHDMLIRPYDFMAHSHSNRFVETWTAEKTSRLVLKPAPKLWLEWPHRAELQDVTYAPGKPRIVDNVHLNTWKGWGVDTASKGDVSPWRALLDILFSNSDPAVRVWFERWCAYPIQHPGTKMASAVLLWGANQGTGKTLCGHTLMRLYGNNATEVKDADLEDTRFTWASNKQFVLADDITGHDNRKLANMFKTMITQKTLHINPKFVQGYTIPDTLNYYFTSNDPAAFYLDDKDRRFFIHEVRSDQLPETLRKTFVAWRDSVAGIQNLFYYMLNLPLGDFDPQNKPPMTASKHDMIHISKSELGVWVARLVHEPSATLNSKLRGDLFTAEDLYILYDPLETKRASPNALARELSRSGVLKLKQSESTGVRVGDRNLRLYAIRNQEQWKTAHRRTIEEHYLKHHPPMPEHKKTREKF